MKPLWFLDIDGVINGWKKPPRYATSWEHVSVTAMHPWEQQLIDFDIHYDPAVIQFINEMATAVDIVWLTSWEDEASTALAPAVGITKHFPNAFTLAGISTTPVPSHYFPKKIQAVRALIAPGGQFYGTNVVWTDDELDKRTRREFAALLTEQGQDSCLIKNFPSDGLRPAEMERIHTFVETRRD